MEHSINYGALIDDAMHHIIKKALSYVAINGLPEEHHFFISFITCYPGVYLSDRLKQRYPNEITIVLQYQFDDLIINNDHFSVVLSFNSVREKIVVPFNSITSFADPSVKFGLQFKHADLEKYKQQTQSAIKDVRHKKQDDTKAIAADNTSAANIINIDFTKKRENEN